MKTQAFIVGIVCLLATDAGLFAQQTAAPKPARPNIYDETLDGAKQVAECVAVAKKEHKRVLLQFGANWCGWCHRLHTLCETNEAIRAKLKADYVVALVDVNKGHNEKLVAGYGAQTYGLPFLIVLDSDGKQLTTKDSGELEEGDHHSPEKVLVFLEKWAPPRSADSL